MRRAWLDYLRVLALLAVIIGHVIADFYKEYGVVGQAEWWLSNILAAFLRFAVPVFVMVSGAVLLGKSYTLQEFYKKRATRLIPPLIFWNLVYLGVFVLDGMDTRTVLWMLKARIMVDGYVAPHLWYLSMFLCLMAFTPYINKFIIGEKPAAGELAVFLGLTFPFFLLNMVAGIADKVYGLSMRWFAIFPWFVVYFIAGYCIDNYSERIPLKNGWIVAGIITLIVIGAGLNYYAVSSLDIREDSFFVNERSPLVFLLSMLIFLLAKKLSSQLTANKVISALAEASFGIYLIHEIFDGIFHHILPDYFSHGLLYIPITIIMTLLLSYVSIFLLRKIPFMKMFC